MGSDLEFPDLERFEHLLAQRPPGAQLRAWSKLEECERRLAVYRWAEQLNDPAQPRRRVLLDDCESAFLLTFESVIQFAKEEWNSNGARNFDEWLRQQIEDDLLIRGLRTLRHLEAHVEARPAGGLIIAQVGAGSGIRRIWRLATLQPEDLDKLHRPQLSRDDLLDWNTLVSDTSASGLLERGLVSLAVIVTSAERVLSPDVAGERA